MKKGAIILIEVAITGIEMWEFFQNFSGL